MNDASQAPHDSSVLSPPSSSLNPPQAPPRRIVRRRPNQANQPDTVAIDPILLKEVLQASNLPFSVYSFEIERTVQRCISLKASHVALQMPEGLLLYATVLVDVLQKLVRSVTNGETNLQVSILSDVTYGACCIDDLTASQLGCQLLIHYGHSCLVPIQHTVIPVQYVFVEIQFYIPHLVQSLVVTLFPSKSQTQPGVKTPTLNDTVADEIAFLDNMKELFVGSTNEERLHLYLLGTIQFRHALVEVRDQLLRQFEEMKLKSEQTLPNDFSISIPQCKPLSPGEVLGCTSPLLNAHLQHDDNNNVGFRTRAVVCFVADGRFHLESTMIANHTKISTFYRYDPYSRVLSVEAYAFDEMKQLRHDAIQYASKHATVFGIILGTLGRQGNPAIVQRIQEAVQQANRKSFVVLLSEITPQKLQLLSLSFQNDNENVLCWVQVACPRLSVDWGHTFQSDESDGKIGRSNRHPTILLNPYELFVCLKQAEWQQDTYPMDYYSTSGGPWTNYHGANKDRQINPPFVI